MSETQALTIRPQQQITQSIWQMVQQLGPVIYQSRLFDVKSPEQAEAIMLKGHELGLGLTASFEFIQVVQRRPGLSPRGCLGLIHQHSDMVEAKIKESTNERCTVWMRRKDTGFEFERTFTMANAVKAGVVKEGSGWDHWPENMLLWRCVGFVADVVCPDLIGGMKRSDEYGADLDANGNTIEGSYTPVSAAPPVPTGPTIADLMARWTPDQIMRAAGNKIPETPEAILECQTVLEGRERVGLEQSPEVVTVAAETVEEAEATS